MDPAALPALAWSSVSALPLRESASPRTPDADSWHERINAIEGIQIRLNAARIAKEQWFKEELDKKKAALPAPIQGGLDESAARSGVRINEALEDIAQANLRREATWEAITACRGAITPEAQSMTVQDLKVAQQAEVEAQKALDKWDVLFNAREKAALASLQANEISVHAELSALYGAEPGREASLGAGAGQTAARDGQEHDYGIVVSEGTGTERHYILNLLREEYKKMHPNQDLTDHKSITNWANSKEAIDAGVGLTQRLVKQIHEDITTGKRTIARVSFEGGKKIHQVKGGRLGEVVGSDKKIKFETHGNITTTVTIPRVDERGNHIPDAFDVVEFVNGKVVALAETKDSSHKLVGKSQLADIESYRAQVRGIGDTGVRASHTPDPEVNTRPLGVMVASLTPGHGGGNAPGIGGGH